MGRGLGTAMEIICDGEIINKHSDGGRYYGGWNNPLEIIPPVGAVIEYMTFNQNHKEGQGVLTEYQVDRVSFTTEEDFNHSFTNKKVKIFVTKLEWIEEEK